MPRTHFPTRATAALVVLALSLFTACGRDTSASSDGAATLESVQVNAARVVLPPPGAPMAAGYFELSNPGKTTLVLESLESAAFESVEMHETVDDDGVSRMRSLANATVAPGETLRFEPGGMHLMLMGPKLPEVPPASISVKLRLRAAPGGQTREVETPFALERPGRPASVAPASPHH